MGLSNLKGNSGYIGQDKRHESGSTGTTGNVSIQKHYLERKLGNFQPIGSGPVTPLIWYIPEIEYITLSTTQVTNWSDSMGTGINFTSTSTPTYDTTDTDFNGLPSVYFIINDFMTASNNALLNLNGTDGFTIYVVAKVISFPGSTYNGLFTKGFTSANGWGIYYYESIPGQWRFYVNGYITNYATRTGTWTDSTNLHIWKMVYDKSNIQGEIIGPSGGVATPFAYTSAVVDNTNDIRIGDWGSTTYDIEAKYGDMLFYNRPLTSVEQLQTENYLKNKYGIL